MWQTIKNKIVSMLQTNTLLQQVQGYEAADLAGDPAALIFPSANEADYRTTSANRRIYAFKLQLLVKRTEPRSDLDAENAITELVDSVTDMFDKYYTLGSDAPGNALVLPAGYTMIRVWATPSTWGYTERETTYRVAELNIKVEVDVDVTLIS